MDDRSQVGQRMAAGNWLLELVHESSGVTSPPGVRVELVLHGRAIAAVELDSGGRPTALLVSFV